jgi:DNA relaxase NicK
MKAAILIDFLTFTVRSMKADDVIHGILGMDSSKFEHLARGLNYYSKSMVHNDIRVLYDGIYGDKMGVCVNMSGRGCAAYTENTGESITSLLVRISKNPDINITRIDIACDDIAPDGDSGKLDLAKMWEYANEGRYRTRLLSRNNQESFKAGQDGAKTIYFGSPSSLYRIRIYDKAKQAGEAGHWVRFEITLKSYYAMQAASLLADSNDLGATVAGIISDKFAFIELNDTNISRCSLADWWADFLGEVQEVKLASKQKFTHGIDEHTKWLRDSCSRIIAKVYCAIGNERFNKEIIDCGKTKLTDADWAMIEDYKSRKAR